MSPRSLNFLPTKATFHLGDQIGVGTVGVVYRATSPDIDHPVAVKLLSPTVMGDENIVERFEREIVVMERMNHPNIVHNFGGGQLEGQLFYAMQLLEHGTLKDRIAQGPLPWPLAAAYAVQISSALQHAHNHGIVHRDLKPSNLFFDEEGNLVLGDFGIARDLQASADITQQGITVGTFSYMSPEQITADSRISGSADLYSLGCVMFEMLTGRHPFSGANFAQVWEQHLHKPAPSVIETNREGPGGECPEWLDELVRRLMAKEPADRPFNARTAEGVLLENLIDKFGKEGTRELTRVAAPAVAIPTDRQPRTWVLWVVLAIAAAIIAMFVKR